MKINCCKQKSDRISRAFNRSWVSGAVGLDISKAFDRVWHAGLLGRLTEFLVRYLALLGVWEIYANISTSYLCSSRLHYWSYNFPTIYQWHSGGYDL